MKLVNTAPRRYRILIASGVIAMILGGVGVRKAEAADKRQQFAEALKRRNSVRPNAGHSRKVSPASMRNQVATSAQPNLSSVRSNGTTAASPLNPSGFGAGRDAFVTTMFEQTFGRQPGQDELDHFSRSLYRGQTPLTKAKILWLSPEHRAMLRDGTAPVANFNKAYHRALAAGKQAQ